MLNILFEETKVENKEVEVDEPLISEKINVKDSIDNISEHFKERMNEKQKEFLHEILSKINCLDVNKENIVNEYLKIFYDKIEKENLKKYQFGRAIADANRFLLAKSEEGSLK